MSGDWFAVNDAGMYTFAAAIIKDGSNKVEQQNDMCTAEC